MIKKIIDDNEIMDSNAFSINELKTKLPQYFDRDGNFMMEQFKEMLKQNDVNLNKEGYSLKFLGKSYAKYLASIDTTTAIVLDKEHNSQEENKNSDNLYIIGDNLDALHHLVKSYAGKIKCIYIDPPYNTGNDGFVYNDSFNFTVESLVEKIGIEEEQAGRIIDLQGQASHSAWLTFIYPRLVLAKELLSDDGVIFISIDDNEQANLKLICDEIFGEQNEIRVLPTIMNLKGNQDEFAFAGTHEYTVCYGKNKELSTITNLSLDEEYVMQEWEEDEIGFYKKGASLKSTGQNSPREHRPRLWYPILYKDGTISLPDRSFVEKLYDKKNNSFDDNCLEKFIKQKQTEGYIAILPFVNKQKARWRWSYNKLQRQLDEIIINYSNGQPTLYKKQRPELNDLPSSKMKSILYKPEYSSGNGTNELYALLGEKRLFNNPKPTLLLKDLFEISTNDNSIILDFFSGSATTADSVMQLNAEDGGNRKYILVQLPEEIDKSKPAYKAGYRTIDEIGRDRIVRAAKKIKEETGADIDYGFKLIRLEEPAIKTLDSLLEFSPDENMFVLDDYVEKFRIRGISGEEVILATWLNQDGYGLNPKVNKIKLKSYELTLSDKSAYIIKSGLETEDVKELVRMIECDELDITRVVVYPYSLSFSVAHELSKNLKVLKASKTIDVIERY